MAIGLRIASKPQTCSVACLTLNTAALVPLAYHILHITSSTTSVLHHIISCRGLVKPDIVFFGEQLPQRFYERMEADFPSCDLLLVMGTSLVVHPFASLIGKTAQCRRCCCTGIPCGLLALTLQAVLVRSRVCTCKPHRLATLQQVQLVAVLVLGQQICS
jgi:hypothetical protein